MARKNPLQHELDDPRKIRDQLRALQKVRAPWYFQAQLQRQLIGGVGTGSRRWRAFLFLSSLIIVLLAGTVFWNRWYIGIWGIEGNSLRPNDPQQIAPREARDSLSTPPQISTRKTEPKLKSRQRDANVSKPEHPAHSVLSGSDSTHPGRPRRHSDADSSGRIQDSTSSETKRAGESRTTDSTRTRQHSSMGRGSIRTKNDENLRFLVDYQ